MNARSTPTRTEARMSVVGIVNVGPLHTANLATEETGLRVQFAVTTSRVFNNGNEFLILTTGELGAVDTAYDVLSFSTTKDYSRG